MILDKPTRQRLASATRFGDIRELESVDSTNRHLLELAGLGAAEGVVVLADHQTAGRGRRGRTWESQPGQALLVSILLRPPGLAGDRRHLVTAAVALAAADACASVAAVSPDLKWPNDLLVGELKLAGLLAVAAGDAIVVGVGINVGWAPAGAISLLQAAGGRPPVDRGALLAGLLEALDGWYGRWDDAADAYRRRCRTLGRRVRVEMADRVVTGLADRVDEQGRLRVVLDDGGGTVALSAADVVHLRV